MDGSLYLPSDHVYYSQVLGQMAILGVEWCDFVVFRGGEIVVYHILADLEGWNNLCERLDGFYVQHVISEILSAKILQENETEF